MQHRNKYRSAKLQDGGILLPLINQYSLFCAFKLQRISLLFTMAPVTMACFKHYGLFVPNIMQMGKSPCFP